MFLSLQHRSADVIVSLSFVTMLLVERAVKTVQPRDKDVNRWQYSYIIRIQTAHISPGLITANICCLPTKYRKRCSSACHKVDGGMEVQLYSFTASALDGGEQSASPPVRFTHDDTHSDIRWTEGWVELKASREALEERKIPGPYREQNHDFLQVQPRRVLNYIHKTTCKLVKNRVIYQCNFRLWCRNICCYTFVHHARTHVKLHKHASTRAHTHTHTHTQNFVR